MSVSHLISQQASAKHKALLTVPYMEASER